MNTKFGKKNQQPYFARAVKRPARIFGAGTSQCVVCSIALGCWPWAKEQIELFPPLWENILVH